MSEAKNIFDKTIRDLKYLYLISIIVPAVFFLLVLFDLIPLSFKADSISVIFERYAIVFSLLAIPAALKLFAVLLKKIPQASKTYFIVKKYKRATYIRLIIISSVTLMNILLYAVTGNMNFFWFTLILFIIYIFCRPSYPELAGLAVNESNNKEKDDVDHNDIQVNENIHDADDNSKVI